ncbi:hypothetical protein BDV96DRAFT_509257 [Lophiotrema nucula]|uniref:Uncharacterized protein n=1 Tax=Lophiotrema nucula TaxID=690887 RepID=A0A6A5YEI5_9PLEO|nr:hypothetical protein BDV96DRAFT_509257 [Lophiotrema nucula]
MRNSLNNGGYSYSSSEPRYAAPPAQPPLPKRSSAYSYRPDTRKQNRWPPRPSVEDEAAALAREFPSPVGSEQEQSSGEAKSRGSVDQYPIIEEIEQARVAQHIDDRRFVLVSDPSTDGDSQSTIRDRRRKSFAERGNMPYLKTDIPDDPPLFSKRVSTPYSYTKPTKESTAPSAGDYFLRYDSVTQSPRAPKNDVFDDSDADEDTTHLRTERKPARYSFVKSDLQKEDLRTNLLGSQTKPDRRRKRPESRSSSPLPVRPSSPLHCERPPPPSPPRSPKLPPRRPTESPPSSRPSSRSGPRATHLSFSETVSPPPIPGRVPVTGAGWNATYPPTTVSESSQQSSRYGRNESMPVPMPRIDVRSPSPARPSRPANPLPYPVDDRPIDAFMPPEEAYQFDHSLNSPAASSPFRPVFPDSPRMAQSPSLGSPRDPQSAFRPSIPSRHTAAEEVPRLHRVRSSSMRSQSSHDSRRSERKQPSLSLDKPLPSCPRSQPSSRYDLWYTLENCPNFDICPTCYDGVFADTHFAQYFKLKKGYDRTIERYCDFSSPWMRLAWLLTAKQQRPKPDLIYALASIIEDERPCPRERELTNGYWYGIPDPRDGMHITNFTICPCDKRQLEALFPSVRGYLTSIPPGDYRMPAKQACSVRVTSRRFPKYLDLLVELDEEARSRGRALRFESFMQLARTNAFKRECQRDTQLFKQAWHFMLALPEFTVCEECYDEVVLPAIQDRNKLASMFNRTVQFVPNESSTDGSSCCLYSKRMRRVWDRALQDEDFKYIKRKALERKEEESRLSDERRKYENYLKRPDMYHKGTADYDKLMRRIQDVDDEWKEWE